MHQAIMEKAQKGHVIDHFNECQHDNRCGNLRFATISLNAHNKRSQPIKSSKYIGVHIRNTNNCSWTAKFKENWALTVLRSMPRGDTTYLSMKRTVKRQTSTPSRSQRETP